MSLCKTQSLTPQQFHLNLLIHMGRRFIINLILQLGKIPLTQKLFTRQSPIPKNSPFLCFLRAHHPFDEYWSSLWNEKRILKVIAEQKSSLKLN